MQNKITKELIIEKTLELIKENEGSIHVNLRKIAKELGCNHTNIYNYFSSREDLLLHTMIDLINQIRKSGIIKDNTSSAENIIKTYTKYIISFAVNNSGWYKFIWFENFNKSDLDKFLGEYVRPEFIMKEPLEAMLPNLSQNEIRHILMLMHGYIHGEISKYICSRSTIESEEDLSNIIIANIDFLLQNIIQKE